MLPGPDYRTLKNDWPLALIKQILSSFSIEPPPRVSPARYSWLSSVHL